MDRERESSGPGPSANPLQASPAPDIVAGSWSERGHRAKNDDYVIADPEAGLFAAADGIGGAPYGDAAAAAACHALASAIRGGASLGEAVSDSEKAVSHLKVLTRSDGTGTTLVAAKIEVNEGLVRIAWSGDSMAYLFREGRIAPLTQPCRDAGRRLTMALGCGGDPSPMERGVVYKKGDIFVLCTDGVWEVLGETGVAAELAGTENLPEVAFRLAYDAAEGGFDNASAVVFGIGLEGSAR